MLDAEIDLSRIRWSKKHDWNLNSFLGQAAEKVWKFRYMKVVVARQIKFRGQRWKGLRCPELQSYREAALLSPRDFQSKGFIVGTLWKHDITMYGKIGDRYREKPIYFRDSFEVITMSLINKFVGGKKEATWCFVELQQNQMARP